MACHLEHWAQTEATGGLHWDMSKPYMTVSGLNLDIEFLRALAIMLTLLAHIHVLLGQAEGWQNLGWFWFGSGVDLFFCISGYVITGLLQRQIQQSPTSLRQVLLPFWWRRAWRLWPAAWFWLAFVLIPTGLLAAQGQDLARFAANCGDALAALLQISNWHNWNCLRGGCQLGDLVVYWSLALEVQFYLVFPFLLYFLPRRALVVLCLVAVIGQAWLTRSVPHLAWFLRTDAMLLGVLIALLAKPQPSTAAHSGWRWLVLLLGLTGLVLADGPQRLPVGLSWVALSAALLVGWAATHSPSWTQHRGLAVLANYLGSRSYALYLAHLPAFYMAQQGLLACECKSPLWQLGVGLPLAMVLAELSWRWIEMPLRAIGRRTGWMRESTS